MQGTGGHVGLPRLSSLAWRTCWPNYAALAAAMLRLAAKEKRRILLTYISYHDILYQCHSAEAMSRDRATSRNSP
jgi:hypothetical protein